MAIDPSIPLQTQSFDMLGMLGRGSQLAQFYTQQKTDGEMNRIYNESQGDLTKMLDLGKQSKLSRFVVPQIQSQISAQSKAYTDQLKTEADIAKTSSEAFKNNQQGQGYGVENSQKKLGAINQAITAGAMSGDKSQILLGLDGLRRVGMLSDGDYSNYFDKLNALNSPEQIKQWAQGLALAGSKDPASYLFQTQNNVADNQTSTNNNIRSTQASMYGTDVAANTADKDRAQKGSQYQQSFEYQAQQDEIKNGQGEVKEVGGKAYIVYKDGSFRPFIGIDGKQVESKINNPAATAQKEETQRLQRVETILPEIEKILPSATNSYLGAGADLIGNAFGISTQGSQATAKLKTLAGQLVSLMPKMSGPQSDKDVAMYKEMAGNLGDQTIPIQTRLAALETIRDLNNKYKAQNEQNNPSSQPPMVNSYSFMP